MPKPSPPILEIESSLRLLTDETRDDNDIYSSIAKSLCSLAGVSAEEPTSISTTIEAIAKNHTPGSRRSVAIVLIRLASHPNLELNNYDSCRHHVVKLIEDNCSDLVGSIWRSKRQNHERIESLEKIHNDTCERLSSLTHTFQTLDQVNNLRETIMRDISHKSTSSYLQLFDFKTIRNSVEILLRDIDNITENQEPDIQDRLTKLVSTITETIAEYRHNPVFVVQDYFIPFLESLETAASKYQSTLSKKFPCDIELSSPIDGNERRYPLNSVGYEIQLPVALKNTGPGVAREVRAICVGDNNGRIKWPEQRLGDIKPGPFVLDINITVIKPTKKLEAEVEIQWSVIGQSNDRSVSFSLSLLSQRTDIDWDSLSKRYPYSLEIVEADEFHGRKDTIQDILNRLDSGMMKSCYITGQKRVGKSSLAKKVESILEDRHSTNCHVLFLDCGEIRHTSGKETLAALGTELESFFLEWSPPKVDWHSRDYSSSLGPLNTLLRNIQRVAPESRFVVILDEFDEINEDLYRFGELARTFFVNLRSISSKKNVAFILVGAERMGFVMASQGQQLNKFDPEKLDSFDLETEWGDYSALVREPVKDSIKFHNSAVHKIYEMTDGHPYFTKILCAAIFNYAVERRDAEVTSSEVDFITRRVVRNLDVNSFSHYLRDGVRGNEEEQEIVAADRSLLLRLWVQCARTNRPVTMEFLKRYARSSPLETSKIRPLIEDFCTRGVMIEDESGYWPNVELFAQWLIEYGFSALILDPLSESLAEAKYDREAKAHVTSDEVVTLVDGWELYGPRKVTEERVRSWLQQVESVVQQRLLFKLLQNVRFIGLMEAHEKFQSAHSWMRQKLPIPIKRKKVQRRDDIYVSYVDGPGKSGADCARIYANVNEIVLDNVIDPQHIPDRFSSVPSDRLSGLVVVDDFIGTGGTLESGLSEMAECFDSVEVGVKHPLSVVALCGTVEGERRVREYIDRTVPNASLFISEILSAQHFAFHRESDMWESVAEMEEAKTLASNLGGRVQPRGPLGYKGQGLLVTLWRNCPNNSLPILYGVSKGSEPWDPLFPRVR